jgi:hypothetical protein
MDIVKFPIHSPFLAIPVLKSPDHDRFTLLYKDSPC